MARVREKLFEQFVYLYDANFVYFGCYSTNVFFCRVVISAGCVLKRLFEGGSEQLYVAIRSEQMAVEGGFGLCIRKRFQIFRLVLLEENAFPRVRLGEQLVWAARFDLSFLAADLVDSLGGCGLNGLKYGEASEFALDRFNSGLLLLLFVFENIVRLLVGGERLGNVGVDLRVA